MSATNTTTAPEPGDDCAERWAKAEADASAEVFRISSDGLQCFGRGSLQGYTTSGIAWSKWSIFIGSLFIEERK